MQLTTVAATMTRTPRVCFVVESGTDVRLVEGLASRFQVTTFARRIQGGVEISQEPSASVNMLRGPSSRVQFAIALLRFLWSGRREFDFVLVQGYGLAALAANFVRLVSGTPTAMLVCSPTEVYYRLRQKYPQPGKSYRARELWGLNALALANALVGRHYIVLSQYLARVVRSHGFRGRTDVLPVYGVDTKRFSPSDEPREKAKARLGLPTTGSLIFFSSRIPPEKNSETLLAAVQRLLRSGRNVWLLHRSGGFEQFRKEADLLGIGDRVIATDAVHPHRDLPQDYRASDICVQASRAEGLGFSPLEALACGVPVIATATGGLSETIVDAETGWTYPVGNVERLTRQLEEVLDNPAEAKRRAVAGRAMVKARFEEHRVFDQFADLVKQAAGLTRKPSASKHFASPA